MFERRNLRADYLGLRIITVSRVKHSPRRCRPGTLSPLFRTLSCCQGRAPHDLQGNFGAPGRSNTTVCVTNSARFAVSRCRCNARIRRSGSAATAERRCDGRHGSRMGGIRSARYCREIGRSPTPSKSIALRSRRTQQRAQLRHGTHSGPTMQNRQPPPGVAGPPRQRAKKSPRQSPRGPKFETR